MHTFECITCLVSPIFLSTSVITAQVFVICHSAFGLPIRQIYIKAHFYEALWNVFCKAALKQCIVINIH